MTAIPAPNWAALAPDHVHAAIIRDTQAGAIQQAQRAAGKAAAAQAQAVMDEHLATYRLAAATAEFHRIPYTEALANARKTHKRKRKQ